MHGSESDVDPDAKTARSREAGGDPDRGKHQVHPDASGSSTGTGENEEFVGRVSGVDETSAGETGAEARAQAGADR